MKAQATSNTELKERHDKIVGYVCTGLFFIVAVIILSAAVDHYYAVSQLPLK
jgi:hypothetical protein